MDRRWWVMCNVSIGIFMSTLDASVVNISLPTIVRSLNTGINAVAWVVTAYLITVTGCLLLVGGVAGRFGQRRVYILALLIFTLGSGLCGISPTIHFLILSRMVQGIGAAGLMVNGLAIVAAVFAEKDRGQALGIVGSVVSAGFLTGPLLGGFLVEHFGWPSVFFVNLPVGALGILLSLRILERDGPVRKDGLDLRGALFLLLFIVLLLLFFNGVGKEASHQPWVYLFFSLLSFIQLIRTEARSPSPLVDLGLFRNRLFASSLGASFFSFLMSAAHVFVLPFFLQNLLRYSPSEAGMLVFPVSLTVMIMAPVGGRISDRVGVRAPATAGLIIIGLGIFSFRLLGLEVREVHILWRQVVLGIGIGLFNPANNSAIIGSLPREKAAIASSFLSLSRNLGMVVGVALAEMIVALNAPIRGELGAGGSPPLESLRHVWDFALLFGVTAALLSWTRNRDERPARKKMQT